MVGITDALRLGSRFLGEYELVAELGAGSFGRVYRARQRSTGQDVALKILGGRRGDSAKSVQQAAERFRRETRLCRELFHPNIVRLIDSGEAPDGTLYATFEYVPGLTLKQLIVEQGRLGVRETVHLMSQVLDALACAHARGIIHRDLKPENIMITQTGARRNAMVLDFGLGAVAPGAGWGLPRLTANQEMIGSPCYAAPEQLRGEPPTARSDLYSWGLVVIECLTGDLAVRGASVQEAVVKQLSDDPVPIPPAVANEPLRTLLQTVTAKRIEQRDATIAGLLRTLQLVEAREPRIEPEADEPALAAQGERRQVTIVSCRLSVSRTDGGRIELEDLDTLSHAQQALCTEVATREGGHLASAFGDRIILVFGYPRAREDDARRAARTALAIVAEVRRRSAAWQAERGIAFAMRIGVHTGLVIARELRVPTGGAPFDLVGLTPQIATRVEERASVGEVLVSLETQRLLRNAVEAEPTGTCELGELGAPTPLFRLTGVRREAPGLETAFQGDTRMVGRARQIAQLSDAWTQARSGNGGVVLITGEPGIGKSRLLRELGQLVPSDAWLPLRCAEESQNSPLRPLAELLSSWDEPIDALLARYGMKGADTAALLSRLVARPGGVEPVLDLPPERQKERTLEALLTLFLRIAAEHPRVLAVEDLHWADPTTLEFLALLAEEIRASGPSSGPDAPRLYLVLTARPHFVPPWSLEQLALMPLPRLARGEIEELVSATVSAPCALPKRVLDAIAVRSDGIPLFVEEVSLVLVEAAAGRRRMSPDEIEIPASLRDLLTARLDAVSPTAKETAQMASVLGREFRYELLQAVSEQPESLVRAGMRELANAGLVHQRRSTRAESHVFKHALLRDTAYESLTRPTRQRLHLRVASTLCDRFTHVVRAQPEVVALHFEHGGQIEKALDYRRQAGALALNRGAYVESIRHLEGSLGLLQRRPPARERDATELAVRTALGVALIATKGYGAEDVERNFSRAQELCASLGDTAELIPTLYGLFQYHLLRGHRDGPGALASRLHQIARAPEHVLIATAARGITAFWTSELPAAIADLEHATALYDIAHQRALARSLGEDAALLAPLYCTWCYFYLGQFDRAHAALERAEALVAAVGSPYITATFLVFGMHLACDLRNIPMTRRYAEEAIAVATEHRFPFFLAAASCGRGWAAILESDADAGIAQIEEGLAIVKGTGTSLSLPYWSACLAEGYLQRGNVAAGLRHTDEGLALSDVNLARLWDPWLHRVKGELLALTADHAGAEAHLRQAVELARETGNKAWELRTVTSLARWRRSRGDGTEIRPILRAVIDSFTEGLDSSDLREAHALLGALHG